MHEQMQTCAHMFVTTCVKHARTRADMHAHTRTGTHAHTRAHVSRGAGEQVRRLAPAAHVFGHTHFSIDVQLGPTRFVQHPLANPQERAFPLCVSTSASAPLAEIWACSASEEDGASGATPAESRKRRRSDPSELSQFLAKMGASWQPPSFKGRARE